jgi:hypothetical protein
MQATSLDSMFTEKSFLGVSKSAAGNLAAALDFKSQFIYKIPQFVLISSPPPQLPLAWYHTIRRLSPRHILYNYVLFGPQTPSLDYPEW